MGLRVACISAIEQLIMDGTPHVRGISTIFILFAKKAVKYDGMVADGDFAYYKIRIQNADSSQFQSLLVKRILNGGGSSML